MSRTFLQKILLTLPLLLLVVLGLPHFLLADEVGDLQTKIQERNQQIDQLQKDIINYQVQLDQTSKQANTLLTAVKKLDLTEKKLTTDIKVTQNQISATSLTIEQLGLQITDKEKTIAKREENLRTTLRLSQQTQDISELQSFFLYEHVGDFWDAFNQNVHFQEKVRENLVEVKELREDLSNAKDKKETQRTKLKSYQVKLGDQQKIVVVTKQQKSALLTETKNKETEYKKTLAEKMALKNALQKELTDFESQLKIKINKSALPQSGSAILSWPVDAPVITQQFGHTDFANSHARVYGGSGHNGIDLRAPIGTPIRAAGPGKVVATGNTDIVCPGASYGQWVLVEHPFGLSTLYAHFSLTKAVSGQTVEAGDLLGYAGDTGYATGPHLHFTVYATQGVQVISRKSIVCRGTYTLPVAALEAYLDPVQYLPSI